MSAFSGSFSGNVTAQTALAVADQPNHEFNLAEVVGIQKSSDEKWNKTKITYWATTDVAGGNGSQRGYFVNDHDADGSDRGTFEGRVATTGSEITVEGTWQYTGGSGKFQGITGGGTFKTRMNSSRQVEASWQGAYELATAKAAR